MKIEFNRFAIVPVLCAECNKFILFEPYRVKKIKKYIFFNEYGKIKMCKDCYRKEANASDNSIDNSKRQMCGLNFEELLDNG